MFEHNLTDPGNLDANEMKLVEEARENPFPSGIDTLIRTKEVQCAIKGLKNSAPGPDLVHNNML